MRRTAGWLLLLIAFTVGPAYGQAEMEVHAAVPIEANVVKGLDTTTGSEALVQVENLVPTLTQGQETLGRLDLMDIEALGTALSEMPKDPGLVVTMVVLGADGSVVSGIASGATLPSWMTMPSTQLNADGSVRLSREGYYIYINVCACTF